MTDEGRLPESYTKLTSSIIHSTIWQQSPEVCKLWITMLAMSNRAGYVYASVPGLAHAANLSIEAIEEGLSYLKSPDKYSRTKEHEGKRLEDCSGGWLILNYANYRKLRNMEERRAQNRDAQARFRIRHGISKVSRVSHGKPLHTPSPTPSPEKDRVVDSSAGLVGSEGVGSGEGEVTQPSAARSKPSREPFKPPSLEDVKAHHREKGYRWEAEDFWSYWEQRSWRLDHGRGALMKSWKMAMATWERNDRRLGNRGSGWEEWRTRRMAGVTEEHVAQVQAAVVHVNIDTGEES